MGKQQRARLAQQRAKERFIKRLFISGTLVAGLTAAAILGYNQLDSKDTKPKAVPTATAPETNSPMAEDLKALLQQASTPNAPVDRLIGMKNKLLATFNIGANKVRIIQAGGDLNFGEVNKTQLDKLQKSFEVFNRYARSGARINMPVFEADENMKIVSQRTAQVALEPVNKDIVMFLVPGSVDIGTYRGEPVTVTSTNYPTITSFVRPDVVNGGEGVVTETCQGTINAKVSNTAQFKDLAPAKFDRVNLMAQENVCNSLAKAAFAVSIGLSYEQYAQIHSRQSLGGTEQPTPGNTAFYSTIPYIGNEASYTSLRYGLSVDIGNSLVYPSVN